MAITLDATKTRTKLALDFHGANGLLLPGVPGVATPEVDEDVYPDGTIDLVKILRGENVELVYADPTRPRVALDLKAAEFWVPITVFAGQVLSGGLGGVVTQALLELVGRNRAAKTVLHAQIGRAREGDREVTWLNVHGPADEAIAAIGRFLDHDDDDD
jgi:hypothetical protein